MNFTKEEYTYLSKFDNNFQTAVYSDYSRNVSRADLEKIHEIYERVIEQRYPTSYTCSACQLSLLKKVGKRYFEDKKAYEELEPELNTNQLQEQATNKDKNTTKGNGKDSKRKTSKK